MSRHEKEMKQNIAQDRSYAAYCCQCSLQFLIMLSGKTSGCTESQFYIAEFIKFYYTVICSYYSIKTTNQRNFIQKFKRKRYFILYLFVARVSRLFLCVAIALDRI